VCSWDPLAAFVHNDVLDELQLEPRITHVRTGGWRGGRSSGLRRVNGNRGGRIPWDGLARSAVPVPGSNRTTNQRHVLKPE